MKEKHIRILLIATAALFTFLVYTTIANASTTAPSAEPKITLNQPMILRGQPASVFALIHFTVPDAMPETPRFRPPLALSLVIDRSGSMEARGKLDYAKQAARQIVDRLGPRDTLSIVEYDDHVAVAYPQSRVRNPNEVKRIINRLEPGGSTNLAGGMMTGVQQVMRHADRRAVRRVILLSDGLANAGVTSPYRIAAMADEARMHGASVTTFGLGLDYNEDLMQAIAESGGGKYYYIESPTQIAETFQEEMGRIFRTVTRDVTLSVTLSEGVRDAHVYGYPGTLNDNRLTITMNDFYAGETRSVLVRFDVAATRADNVPLGTVAMDYEDLAARERRAHSHKLALSTTDEEAEMRRAENKEASIEAILITADQAHEESLRLYERGDVVQAKEQMAALTTQLKQDSAQYDDVQIGKKLEAMEMEASEIERSEQDAQYRKNYLKKSKQTFYNAKQGKRGKYLLMEGAANMDVRRLQQALKDNNVYQGPVDGRFTPEVADALKKYQQSNSPNPDGVAGPKTLRSLGLY